MDYWVNPNSIKPTDLMFSEKIKYKIYVKQILIAAHPIQNGQMDPHHI